MTSKNAILLTAAGFVASAFTLGARADQVVKAVMYPNVTVPFSSTHFFDLYGNSVWGTSGLGTQLEDGAYIGTGGGTSPITYDTLIDVPLDGTVLTDTSGFFSFEAELNNSYFIGGTNLFSFTITLLDKGLPEVSTSPLTYTVIGDQLQPQFGGTGIDGGRIATSDPALAGLSFDEVQILVTGYSLANVEEFQVDIGAVQPAAPTNGGVPDASSTLAMLSVAGLGLAALRRRLA